VNGLAKGYAMSTERKVQKFGAYSIAADQGTDIKDNAHFAGFIRGVNEGFQLM